MSKINILETTNLSFKEVDIYELNLKVKVEYGATAWGPCKIPATFKLYDKNNNLIKTYSTTFVQSLENGTNHGRKISTFNYKVSERTNKVSKIVATITMSQSETNLGANSYTYQLYEAITTATISYMNPTSNKIKDDVFNIINNNPLLKQSFIFFE